MLIFFRVLQLLMIYGGGAFLCYAPFHGKLRIAPIKLTALLSLIFLVEIAGHIGLLMFVSESASHAWLLIYLPACGVFYLWSVKESFYKSVLVLLLTACYATFLCGCAVFIANLIFRDKGNGYELLYTVAVLFIGGATYLMIYKFMIGEMIPIVNLVSSNELRSLYFIPLFYIILQVAFFIFYDYMEAMSDLVYFVVLVAINGSTYFWVMDLLYILKVKVDKMRMQEEITISERLLEMQKNQYASWETQIEAVRRARHDLKHHVAMIQSFLDKNDRIGLQKHVEDFQRTLPETAPMQLCKNMAVNTILLHYYERSRKDNVTLELLVNVDEDIAINPQDLAVVFGNCLENAFEACGRMEATAEKKVSLMAKPMGKGLAIVIDNTFDGEAVKENDVYLSSKREKQVGIGMASVKLVVQKYSGVVSFETEGNLFMTSIRLAGKTM